MMLQRLFINLEKNIQKSSCRYITSSINAEEEKINASQKNEQIYEEEQFRVIDIIKKKIEKRPLQNFNEKYFKQPREKKQSVTQDWGNVWPGIKSFHPATVPLPLKMGYPAKGQSSPVKYGNAELMKIPNFLHLTPPVIERQCAALKKFCTQWPKEIEEEDAQDYFFPMTIETSSYLHSSPTLRDPRARVANLSINVDSLDLDTHGLDKLLRLVGDRFNPETRKLTLIVDRCPLSMQNINFAIYLLTVLYNESLKVEPWEHEKSDNDYELFDYERSKAKKSINELEKERDAPFPDENINNYKEALRRIHNEDDNEDNLENYRNAVLKLLSLN